MNLLDWQLPQDDTKLAKTYVELLSFLIFLFLVKLFDFAPLGLNIVLELGIVTIVLFCNLFEQAYVNLISIIPFSVQINSLITAVLLLKSEDRWVVSS